MENKKIVITGISGFLGFNLALRLAEKNHVTGFYHHNKVDIPNVSTHPIQITHHETVEKAVKDIRPDMIFHLASISNPNQCEENPGVSYAVNVTGTRNVVAAARKTGARLVFTSSDLVFDGENAPYTEQSEAAPVNRYGRQKAEAEESVLEYENGTVVRLPLMFGPKSPHSGSFLQPMVRFLKAQSKVTLFEDEFRTPISSHKAIQGLLLAAGSRTPLLHISCNEKISRYNLGLIIADYLDIDKALVAKNRRDDVRFPASRPADTSLDISRALQLGFDPGSLREELFLVLRNL